MNTTFEKTYISVNTGCLFQGEIKIATVLITEKGIKLNYQ
mgnify:CR=1 FL=1